ncbi:hypothetical protein VCCP1035_3689B, partial [Vibrio cholerae CP1035(8)]
GGSSC